MTGRILLGVCVAAVVSSCSPSPQGLVRKHQADYERKLASLDAIAATVVGQLCAPAAIALPAAGPKMELDDIYPFYNYRDGAASAPLFSAEDLQDPEEKNNTGMHLFPAKESWLLVRKMVRDGAFPKSKEEAVKALTRVAGWRYAVVLRGRTVQAPGMAGEVRLTNVTDQASYASGSFVPGALTGDVLVYDLEDGRFLGGFPVTAHSSEQLEVTSYGGGDPAAQRQRALELDFTEQLRTAVFYGLLDRLPQERVSMNGNIRADVNAGKGRR
jgi:hypothetical protein